MLHTVSEYSKNIQRSRCLDQFPPSWVSPSLSLSIWNNMGSDTSPWLVNRVWPIRPFSTPLRLHWSEHYIWEEGAAPLSEFAQPYICLPSLSAMSRCVPSLALCSWVLSVDPFLTVALVERNFSPQIPNFRDYVKHRDRTFVWLVCNSRYYITSLYACNYMTSCSIYLVWMGESE